MILLPICIRKPLARWSPDDNVNFAKFYFYVIVKGVCNVIINLGIFVVTFVRILCIMVVLKGCLYGESSCLKKPIAKPACTANKSTTLYFDSASEFIT